MKGFKRALGITSSLVLTLSMSVATMAATLNTYGTSGNELTSGGNTYTSESLVGDSETLGSWSGLKGLPYRTGLYVKDSTMQLDKSVEEVLSARSYDATQMDGLSLTTATPGFSAVIIKDSDSYTINDATITMNTNADGSTDVNDFAGLGAAVDAINSMVTLQNSTITTTGVAKLATFADSGADLIVKNSTLRSNGGTIYSGYYNTADQSKMINPPWVLGISGSARTTNIMGANTTGTYVDSTISAAGWGALSTDSGSNMRLTAVNCDVVVDGSGYGAYAIGDGTEETFLGTSFDVDTYAAILTGASVTLGSYTGGQSVSIDKIDGGTHVTDVTSNQVAEGQVVNSSVTSDNFGFMFHANGSDNTNNLTLNAGTDVHTANATFLVKKVNNNINVNGATIATDDGTILQMMDNDDDMVGVLQTPPEGFGMPTFNYSFHEPDGWSYQWQDTYGDYTDSGWTTNASFANTTLNGNIYNGTGYAVTTGMMGTTGAGQSLNVVLGSGATLNGAIAATAYQHLEKDFAYYVEGEGYNGTRAAQAAGKLGHVKNMPYYNGTNNVAVSLTDNAKWTVTDTSLVTSLTIGQNATVNGLAYEFGGYDADGNVIKGNQVTLVSGQSYNQTLVLTATPTSTTTTTTTSPATGETTPLVLYVLGACAVVLAGSLAVRKRFF